MGVEAELELRHGLQALQQAHLLEGFSSCHQTCAPRVLAGRGGRGVLLLLPLHCAAALTQHGTCAGVDC